MIIEKARELGVALAQSPEFVRMAASQEAIEDNDSLSAILREYKDTQEKLIGMLESDENDKECIAALSQDVERLRAQASESPLFIEAVTAEKAFSDLLTAINREIGACINIGMNDGCGGDCSHCGGCSN